MKRFEVRWKNFRGFRDTGWVKIRPVTILIGANATGKTSFLAPLLLLKQTIESSDSTLGLKTIGDYFNAGIYKNLIFAHDPKKELSFAIRFGSVKNPDKTEKIRPVGTYAPAEVSFDFTGASGAEAPLLKRYTVRDGFGRVMVRRTRLQSGRFSVQSINFSKSKSLLSEYIRQSPPERFLFTAEAAFKQRVIKETNLGKKVTKSEEKKLNLRISKAEDEYISVVTFVNAHIKTLLHEISYLGPLSEHPRRMYELSGEVPQSVGSRGEYAPEILFRRRNTKLRRIVDNWISRFDLGFHLNCNELTEGAFNITLNRSEKSPKVNIADTGFGLSQILPLVVQGFYAPKRSLIISEQPEIHLNPRLQTLLAELFCDIAARDVGSLVETHSEHMLLTLRKLIAEKRIKETDVAVYYTEKNGDYTEIRSVPIAANGHIKLEDWPQGFFGEALQESLALAAAQAKGGKTC
jgi:predicted ATPase